MTNGQIIRGQHFTCLHTGQKEEWSNYGVEPPEAPFPAKGKRFLRKDMDSAGLELSLNVAQPGQEMPFLHKHQQNDEVFIIISGRGQFLIDGACIDVKEGSVIRIGPPAARAWRNNSDAPLYFLCVQYHADSVVQGGTLDGLLAEGRLAWD